MDHAPLSPAISSTPVTDREVIRHLPPHSRPVRGSIPSDPLSAAREAGVDSSSGDDEDEAPAYPLPWVVVPAQTWSPAYVMDADGETVLRMRNGGLKEQTETAREIVRRMNGGGR